MCTLKDLTTILHVFRGQFWFDITFLFSGGHFEIYGYCVTLYGLFYGTFDMFIVPYLRQSRENDTKLINFSMFWGNFNFQYYNIAMLYTISGQWISGCNWVLTFDEQHQLFLKSRVHKSRNFKCANFNLKVHAWVCQISLVWNIYSNISEEYLFVSYLHHFLIQSYLEFVDTVFCLPIIF